MDIIITFKRSYVDGGILNDRMTWDILINGHFMGEIRRVDSAAWGRPPGTKTWDAIGAWDPKDPSDWRDIVEIPDDTSWTKATKAVRAAVSGFDDVARLAASVKLYQS